MAALTTHEKDELAQKLLLLEAHLMSMTGPVDLNIVETKSIGLQYSESA